MDTTQQDTTAVAVASPTPQVSPEILEQVAVSGDLSGLTAAHVTAAQYAILQAEVTADVP
jgi:hypothetical protein